MPTKRTNRLPLRTANERGSAETIRTSIGRGTPSLASRITTPIERVSPRVLPEAEIDGGEREDYDSDDDDDEPEPTNHGDGDDDDDDRRDTFESEVTMADMRDMLEQQRKLIAILFQNAEMKPPTPRTKSKDKFEITHPKRYCGGPRELETVLSTLRSNFRTHNHLFPGGDTNKVQYALDHLGSWVNHPDHTQRKTSMTDPVTWGHDLLADDHTCLHDYDLFVTEIRKQYGDKDRKQNSPTRAYHEMMQGYHNSDENIRAYANRLRRIWREAGWDEEQHKIMLYNIIWAGLKPYLHAKLRPFTKANGRFDSIDELFDTVADVETPPRNYDKQQRPTESGSGNQKGKKRPHQPSTQTGESSTSGAGSGTKPGSKSTLPPAPWVTRDERQRRFDARVCLRCGVKGHQSRECPKYSPAEKPKQKSTQKLDTIQGERHVKR
jgi:hypothetical protein